MIAALLAVAGVGPARAEEAPPRFELTPHAGYRFGGSFERDGADEVDLVASDAQGLLFDIRASADTQWEVLYARQRTRIESSDDLSAAASLEIEIEQLHFGGTYLADGRLARPFVAVTAGLSRFEPGIEGRGGETYFSGSVGGGVHLRADKRIGVRLEGRLFASFIDSDRDLFCATGPEANVCAVAADGSVLYQWEARAGVVFRF